MRDSSRVTFRGFLSVSKKFGRHLMRDAGNKASQDIMHNALRFCDRVSVEQLSFRGRYYLMKMLFTS